MSPAPFGLIVKSSSVSAVVIVAVVSFKPRVRSAAMTFPVLVNLKTLVVADEEATRMSWSPVSVKATRALPVLEPETSK